MSTTDFDKFDLEGLSLQDIEPANKVEAPEGGKLEPTPPKAPEIEVEVIEAIPVETPQVIEEVKPVEAPQPVEIVATDEAKAAKSADEQMTCPKCELAQPKAEQCSGCGVYVKKAAAMGQSKIQITSTKF